MGFVFGFGVNLFEGDTLRGGAGDTGTRFWKRGWGVFVPDILFL